MACPHFEVSIRTGPISSAVAASAYISASNLFSEREQVRKRFTNKSDEIFFTEVLLPANAPPEYINREVLWNSVEMNEKQYNAQYCRVIKAAIPRDINKSEYINYIREFCTDTFVNKGMCCEYAIHDKHDGNPHVHILLTMRAIDNNGKWLPKCKKEYILDKNGNKTYYPNGEAKSRKINTTDWNNKGNVEKWRHSWEVTSNKYLEKCGSSDRLDLRSYERQGINKLPTEHLGPAASALERKGVETDVGNLNRVITKFNDIIDKMSKLFEEFVNLFISHNRKGKEQYLDPLLPELFFNYVSLREPQRKYLPYNKRIVNETQDIAYVYSSLCYLKSINVLTLDDLKDYMSKVEQDNSDIYKQVDVLNNRKAELEHIVRSRKVISTKQNIYDEYSNIHFKKLKEKYYTDHKKDIDSYIKNKKYLNYHDSASTHSLKSTQLIQEAKNIDVKISALQKQLDVFNKDEFIKLKNIYDTINEAGIPVQRIEVTDKDYIVSSRVSINSKLNTAKQRVKEEYRTKRITHEYEITTDR